MIAMITITMTMITMTMITLIMMIDPQGDNNYLVGGVRQHHSGRQSLE